MCSVTCLIAMKLSNTICCSGLISVWYEHAMCFKCFVAPLAELLAKTFCILEILNGHSVLKSDVLFFLSVPNTVYLV